MSKDIGFCGITEDICREDGECETCSLKHIHENMEHYAKLHEQGRLIEAKEGHWIDNHCSICGMTPLGEELWEHLDLDPPKFEYYMKHCPNCGARMKSEVKK